MKKIIQTLLALESTTRLTHWRTKTLPSHEALGDLYEALSEKLDKLVESYQGDEGVFEDLKHPESHALEIPEMIEEIHECCELLEKGSGKAWVDNQLQDIQADLYKAIYKLKNFDYKNM